MQQVAEKQHKTRHIADIAMTIQPGDTWQREPPVTTRTLEKVSLSALDTSHPQVATAVQAAYDWQKRRRADHLDASLVLAGPYGTGKTHIARAILWTTIDGPEGHPDAWVPAGKFFMANDLLLLMAAHQDRATGMVSAPRPSTLVGSAPLVVIDDIGGEQSLPYISKDEQAMEISARYFRFVNYCYTSMVGIIATTNLSISGGNRSDFAQHIGGRAFDRLSQMAPAGFMVGLHGVPSWRVKSSGRPLT